MTSVGDEIEMRMNAIEKRLERLENVQERYGESVVEINTKVDGLMASFERRIELLETSYEQYGQTLGTVDEKVTHLTGKVDGEFSKMIDSTNHLRGFIDMQGEQNNRILQKVLEGNQKAEERDDVLKTKKWSDWVQIITTLISSGGLIFIIIKYFLGV